MVAGALFGNIANKAGIWIKPPPPTTASIKPARKLALAKIRKSGNNSGMVWKMRKNEGKQRLNVTKAGNLPIQPESIENIENMQFYVSEPRPAYCAAMLFSHSHPSKSIS
jgi:hypothetical protein